MAAAIRRKLPSSASFHVFDVYKPSAERFSSEFGSVGPVHIETSPRDVASKAHVVVSMVPGPREVESIYLDPKTGIVAALGNENRVLLECSTIDTETARKVSQLVREAGQGIYADAPVSVRTDRPPSAVCMLIQRFPRGAFLQLKNPRCLS